MPALLNKAPDHDIDQWLPHTTAQVKAHGICAGQVIASGNQLIVQSLGTALQTKKPSNGRSQYSDKSYISCMILLFLHFSGTSPVNRITAVANETERQQPYRPGNAPPSPTQAQIDDILRPARPKALRVYGHNTTADNGCWLRLCYTNEEGYNTLWSANELAEWVTYDGVVLDDESIFGGLDLAAALEIFPERVVNERVNFENREESLRDAIEDAEEGDWDENPLEPYALYQAECVVTYMYVEDDVADDGSESNYDGAWFERVWKGDFEGERGEVGPAYQEGGSRGPPYTL
ncbi:hypothetical protein PENARI_c023G01415 [Penicillium arizonense]|uniref:Uncharacterized protein n=1 Tax=Penicillium arizonense TaxID=1835702 RepID=A0A1F5L845_PENAI|nr:hypothetical protein PENARI_c023G01415 [Penicillium arizonense]OGE49150.1 hypothetical protein PENARI_c023G01415 [Penicillium arizonense]